MGWEGGGGGGGGGGTRRKAPSLRVVVVVVVVEVEGGGAAASSPSPLSMIEIGLAAACPKPLVLPPLVFADPGVDDRVRTPYMLRFDPQRARAGPPRRAVDGGLGGSVDFVGRESTEALMLAERPLLARCRASAAPCIAGRVVGTRTSCSLKEANSERLEEEEEEAKAPNGEEKKKKGKQSERKVFFFFNLKRFFTLQRNAKKRADPP